MQEAADIARLEAVMFGGEVERSHAALLPKVKDKAHLSAFQEIAAKEALDSAQTATAHFQNLGWGAKKRIKP